MADDFGFMVDRSQGNDPLGMHARTSGGNLPDIISLCWDKYVQYITKEYNSLKRSGQKLKQSSPVAAAQAAPIENFIKFAKHYLNRNRPTNQFVVDNNVGVVLRDHTRCCIAPNTVKPGQMQDSGAIQVTTGESQPELDGMEPGGSLEIK